MPQQPLSHGFTLVETIVVVAIVGILSLVAIPRYASYVEKTKLDAVDALAQTVSAAANLHYRRTGVDPTLAQLNLSCDTTEFSIQITPPNVRVTMKDGGIASLPVPYREET